jgi:UDP-N-acetylglucosamine 2-epimerase
MKNIVLIIGARPNYMKAFPVYEALKNDFKLTLIHTGQHFDEKMKDIFFNQLNFPEPDIHLSLEKKTKAGDFDSKLYVNNCGYLKDKDTVINELMTYNGDLGQLGEIRDKLKFQFQKINPDLVMVFGDVTSTLAAGLSSKILNIELAHVESGLRSGDIKMPEEVNRILTDHISKYYFVTEPSGVDNLKKEGITENVYLVGNTMIDTQKIYFQKSLNTKYNKKLGIESKKYVLITLHRPSNVDDLDKLKEIFDDFEELSKKETLVYPIHPRTKNNLEKLGYLEKVQENPNIILDEPLGYLEFTCLMANCKYVVTDSGGLQEESTSLDIPCFTLRENTERPSTLIENNGTNQLIHKISEIELKECKNSMDLWDGKSSQIINNIISKNINIYLYNKFKKIVLIPIGGLGTRFKDNGYKRPKTLINVFGEPIIYHLINNLNIDDETLLYIIYNDEYKKYRFEDMLMKNYPEIHFKFYHLLYNTEGASETINIALRNINLTYDLPILCLDSDIFYTEDIFKTWNYQNVILYFDDYSEKPLYSYIKYDNCEKIIDIKEKEKISNNACCGCYGFSSYKQLLYYTQKILDENFKLGNEFYTSSCIKRMLQDKITFYGVKIKKENYHCLGTPIQLKQFYNNIPNVSCYNLKKKTKTLRFCFDLDNTLVSYPKIPNDYSSVEPIEKTINFVRYLKNFGHTIIIHTARRMKTHKGNLGGVIADIGKITFDTLEKFDIPYDELYFGKPQADFYIDDNAVSAYNNLEKELGFYQDSIKPRDFNSVEKTSIEIYTKRADDLAGEIYYYSNIPNEIKDMFPLFINFDIKNTWYSIEKINGLTLSNLYLSELLTFTTLETILKSIKRIQSVKIEKGKINIYENYKNKLKKRYENFNYTNFPNSGETYKTLYEKLEEYENNNKGKKSCIHGDAVFTNILINVHEKIKFIDMRGKQGNTLTIYGDWMYDWAKFYQSLIGYDEILLDKEIKFEYKKAMISKFEELFINWYSKEDLENLKIITNSLLFTLIPLHNNEKCIKYYNLILI